MCNVHGGVIVQKPCYRTQALRVMCGLKLYETKKSQREPEIMKNRLIVKTFCCTIFIFCTSNYLMFTGLFCYALSNPVRRLELWAALSSMFNRKQLFFIGWHNKSANITLLKYQFQCLSYDIISVQIQQIFLFGMCALENNQKRHLAPVRTRARQKSSDQWDALTRGCLDLV